MASSRFWISLTVLALLFVSPALATEETPAPETVVPSDVITLDFSNFSDVVSKHPFIVVEFYAPWCGHCKSLALEYENAATVLSKHVPPIVLAKIDASDEVNREIAAKYEVKGFPTLKILRNGGASVSEYKGPRQADGIIEFLKKQVGPASVEVRSSDEAVTLVGNNKVSIVGIFPKFSGEEFENFTKVAEKLRSDFDFGHTSYAKLLPRGDQSVKTPVVRLFKPFDQLVVDFEDFRGDALENFIESASMPLVVTLDKDPRNHPYLLKFFNRPNAKAMLFLDFGSENFDAFKSQLQEVAEKYKEKRLGFLIGDLDASKGALKFYGLREEEAPIVFIQENGGKKFRHLDVAPDQISAYLKDYFDGKLEPFRKSEPIPEVNDEPVKIVVSDNLDEVVIDSGKNVLLEFYAPWCGHCKKLAPILEEVAVSFQNDADVIIAKMDATENDPPSQFEVTGFPTMYFSSASGKLVLYEGDRTKEDIISFIEKNRDSTSQSASADTVKDEL